MVVSFRLDNRIKALSRTPCCPASKCYVCSGKRSSGTLSSRHPAKRSMSDQVMLFHGPAAEHAECWFCRCPSCKAMRSIRKRTSFSAVPYKPFISAEDFFGLAFQKREKPVFCLKVSGQAACRELMAVVKKNAVVPVAAELLPCPVCCHRIPYSMAVVA